MPVSRFVYLRKCTYTDLATRSERMDTSNGGVESAVALSFHVLYRMASS